MLTIKTIVYCRETFSFRVDVPCQTKTGSNYPSNPLPRKIRLSNRYDNQTKVTVCLKAASTASVEDVSTCRKGVLVRHYNDVSGLPEQPSIPKINVRNIPQPIEDVSFWESIVRYGNWNLNINILCIVIFNVYII